MSNDSTQQRPQVTESKAAVLLLIQAAAPRPSVEKHALEAAVLKGRSTQLALFAPYRPIGWQQTLTGALLSLEAAGSIHRSPTGYRLTGFGYIALRNVRVSSQAMAQLRGLMAAAFTHQPDSVSEMKALTDFFDMLPKSQPTSQRVESQHREPNRGRRGLFRKRAAKRR